MRYYNQTILLIVLVFFITGVTSGCKKFVQIEPAANFIESNLVFASDNTALSAVGGVYVALRSGPTVFSNSGFTVNGALAADEIYATTPTTNTNLFYLNQLTQLSSITSGYYNSLYQVIYRANSIVEGLAKSTGVSDSIKVQLTGEMKVIRAMEYFYLVNLWGDVPLVTSTDYRENAVLPRADAAQVYEQIIADLTEAQKMLPENYTVSGKTRTTKWAATALLARVYLYRQDWTNAERQASLLINSGKYNLVPGTSIGNVFLKNSNETIWEVAPPNDVSVVGDASAFVPSSSTIKPTYALTSYLLNTFETGDKRNQSTGWVGKNSVGGLDYYYPAKYKQRSIAGAGNPTEYKIMLRLAEVMLIRAEARAHLDNISGAQEDLNKIRNRAGLANTTADTQASLLTAIEKERQVELFAEWGHRWLDLKRTDRANTILGAIKGNNWQATDTLWPIPEKEILYNSFLKQNPGY